MTTQTPVTQRLRVAHLNPRGPTPFRLSPDKQARVAMADELGITALPDAQLSGHIAPHAGDAWALEGKLTARVVQTCVITLEPVQTLIDEKVHRIYSPHLRDPDEELAEMPDDDLEPLGSTIDLGAVLIEELALALPLYPRLPDAQGDAGQPQVDEVAAGDRRKPFADLDKLLKRGD